MTKLSPMFVIRVKQNNACEQHRVPRPDEWWDTCMGGGQLRDNLQAVQKQGSGHLLVRSRADVSPPTRASAYTRA